MKPSWNRGSLRARFLIVFGVLTIVPLAATAVVLGERNASNLEAQSVELQEHAASRVGAQIESMLTARESELRVLDEVAGIGELASSDQEELLRQLLAVEPMYQELAILGRNGQESIRLSRGLVVLDQELTNAGTAPAFGLALTEATPQFGPVVFDETLRQPLITVGYPLIDRQTGRVESVVLATVRFKPIWDLLRSLSTGDANGEIYVADVDGRVVAHRDPTIVLLGTTVVPPESDGRAIGLGGAEVVAASHDVSLGSTHLTVIAEEPLGVALAAATRAVQIAFFYTVFAVIAVAGAVVLVTHRVVRPIEEVAESARRVAAGDRSHLVAARGNDEVMELAVAFNQMTLQLDDLIETLEQRVEDRTREIGKATQLQATLIAELEAKNAEMVVVKERLEGLIQSKDEFLGAVSHELRTPLTSVIGFASLIRETRVAADDVDGTEMIDRVVEQAQDMADIINDLLLAARMDGGSMTVDAVPVDIQTTVQCVVDTVPEADLRIEGDRQEATAFADPGRVRQILRNLFVNVARYGGDEALATIRVSGPVVLVEVRDRGGGVPEADWELIFDPYRRAENHPGDPASVGLGLSVSRSLARRMGGDLTYRYEEGTSIFTLELPAYVEPAHGVSNFADATQTAPSKDRGEARGG